MSMFTDRELAALRRMGDDYSPPRPTTERGRILAILDCIRAHLGEPEAKYLRALSQTHMDNGNPREALACWERAVGLEMRGKP